MRTPASRSTRVVVLLRRRACPVVRVRGNEEADTDAAPRRLFDAPDHRAVGHVRVDDVESRGRAVEQLRDRVGDRPVPAGRVVEHDGRDRIRAASSAGKSASSSPGDLTPSQRRLARKTSWSCETTGPFDADEEVVEAAVVEVILDPGAADPADAAVDDHDLAMVDVPEPAEVPARSPARAEGPTGPVAGLLSPRRSAHRRP